MFYRLEVAVANAKQQEIQAQVSEQVSRAAILTAIEAEPTDTTVDFEEPRELEKTPGPSPSLADAFAQAQKSRPELAAAQFNVSAEEHRARSHLYGLLPGCISRGRVSAHHRTGLRSGGYFGLHRSNRPTGTSSPGEPTGTRTRRRTSRQPHGRFRPRTPAENRLADSVGQALAGTGRGLGGCGRRDRDHQWEEAYRVTDAL